MVQTSSQSTVNKIEIDVYKRQGHKYGLARGFSYDELSEEEKRGRKRCV